MGLIFRLQLMVVVVLLWKTVICDCGCGFSCGSVIFKVIYCIPVVYFSYGTSRVVVKMM